MVLKISNNANHFTVEGDLILKTLQEFIQTFQSALIDNDEVTIDIKGLKRIDRHGVNAIAKLHNESLLKGKRLSIIGLGNKEIYQHISGHDAA